MDAHKSRIFGLFIQFLHPLFSFTLSSTFISTFSSNLFHPVLSSQSIFCIHCLFHPLFPYAMHEFHLNVGNKDFLPHQLVEMQFPSQKLETNYYTGYVIVATVGTSIMAHLNTNFWANYDSHLNKLRVAQIHPALVCALISALHPCTFWLRSMKLKSMRSWKLQRHNLQSSFNHAWRYM